MSSKLYLRHSGVTERFGSDHPGQVLRQHVLPALDLSVSRAARELSVTRQTLHRILAGQAAVTPEMAVRLERFCGVPALFWLRLQLQYELDHVQVTLFDALAKIPSHALAPKVLRQIGTRYEQ